MVANDVTSTTLDPDFLSTYSALVNAVTSGGAYAMIDVHNYARWNGAIIGQDTSVVTQQDVSNPKGIADDSL